MHTLAWKGPLNLSITFMHPGVKSFDIWLPDDLKSVSPRPFFQDIAIRMPNITDLNIKSEIAIHDIEADLIDLMNRLPNLRSVTFPRYYVTTRFMEALSRMPNLAVIEFQYYDEQGSGDANDVIPFTPFLEAGSFPVLWDLSLSATLDETSRLFSLEFAPVNLTLLYVDSGVIETAASIQGFLCTIADSCRLLKALVIISLRYRDSAPEDADERYKITFEHLKPVFKLVNLKSLEISHLYPLALKMEDVESFASSWPSLESLILNDEPVYLQQSGLTMEALLPFANHCPNLIRLGLFVDASHISPITAPFSPFKRLQRLSMGVSIIDDDKSVALYLSNILPSACSVECGVQWNDDELPSDVTVYREVDERCSKWEEVGRLVPVLIKLRTEEKERLRQMESEMDDLRMRNEMLSHTLKSGLGQVIVDDNACIVI